AAGSPATIRVFQKLGIDFCCGGKRGLGEVCAEKGLGFDAVKSALDETVASSPVPAEDWTKAPLDALTAHIVERYHGWLYEEMPRLSAMMDKVLRVHGDRHPELDETARLYRAIQDDLGPHMMKEERVLFPYV